MKANQKAVCGLFIFCCLHCLSWFTLTGSLYRSAKGKKIGVRKTFGASIATITLLLSTEFSKWVLIANIVAWPVAWYFFDQWLNNFNYRTSIEWWYFVIAGAISFLVALLTVSYQTIKSASANPIDALKYE